MASGGYGPVLRQVDRLLGVHGTASGLGEGALLRRFADGRDEAAFEALVTRHGPMVLGTCRRILADPHDVDDAFQATFLVLARKAGSIRDGDRLGPWLHGVARRVATRSRTLSARRAARERPGAEERASAGADPSSELVELRAALDEELARLPEKYRAPLVLCYLEGLTHDEAAVQLSWPVGTVRSRLARGRDRLRSRLTRRGLSPSAAVPAILPAPAIPEVLISSTVRIATAAGSVPAHVASLAKGALIAMMWHKLRGIAAVGLLAGLAAGGAGALAKQAGRDKPTARQAAPPSKTPDETSLDLLTREVAAIEAAIPEAEGLVERLRRDREEGLRAIAALKKKRTKPDGPAPTPAPSPAPAPPGQPAEGASTAPGEAASQVLDLSNGSVLIISGKHDRATVLDVRTGKRTTCRFPGTVTDLNWIVGNGGMGFAMKGPDIRRIAVYDFHANAWASLDLHEPVRGEVSPIFGATEVAYQAGPIQYLYSTVDKRWGGVEVPGADGQPTFGGVGSGANNLLALAFRGDEIRRISVQELDTAQDFPIELREPAKGPLYPAVSRGAVAYQAGRFVYAFSPFAKKWSVLELKAATPVLANTLMVGDSQHARMVIPDGGLIHCYDARTGEWTHIDTKDDK